MSLKDLEKMGLLKPEKEWVQGELTSTLPPTLLAIITVIGILGCITIGFGNGGFWTWIGIIAFLTALVAFVLLTVWSISRQ